MGGKYHLFHRLGQNRAGHRFKFQLRNWQLVLILIPLLFLTATLLRLDHIQMVELRDAVMAADDSEDDKAIAEALTKLQEFTFSHVVINITEANGRAQINFGTGPFYLEKQYLRYAYAALEKAEAEFVDTGNPNGNVYGKAMNVCKPQAIANHWSWNSSGYINCMLTEIAKYPTTDALDTTSTANLPSTELFRHDYHSPVFAPTPAGFAMLICIILLIVIIIRILIWLVIEISLIFIKKV